MDIVYENTSIFIVSPFLVRAAFHLEYIYFVLYEVRAKFHVSAVRLSS